MAMRTVPFSGFSSTTITADVPDDIADDPEAVALYMQENCDFPTLCHQCVGMGGKGQNLELGDEWEPVRSIEDNTVEMWDGE